MSERESNCCGCDSKSTDNNKTSSVPIVASPNNTEKVLNLFIEQMDCPTEEALLRNTLEKMPGVNSLDFNLMNRRLSIKHTIADTSALIDTVTALGMLPVNENTQPTSHTSKIVYSIENMDCPTEEGLIRNKIGPMPGIAQLDFNLMQRKLTVTHTLENPDPIQAALTSIGMQAVLLSEEGNSNQDVTDTPPPNVFRKWWLLGAAAAAAVLAETYTYINGSEKSLAGHTLVCFCDTDQWHWYV